MKHARVLPGSVVLGPIYLPSYTLWSHLILLFSLPCESCTNNVLLSRHERRSFSPPNAASIFDSLEYGHANFAVPLDSFNGLPPLHHSVPEQQVSRSGGSYENLPPTTRSIDELLTDCEIESRSAIHRSSALGQSEGFWHHLLISQLNDDLSSTWQTTANTVEPNVQEASQSLPSAPLVRNTFSSNELRSIRGFGSTTQMPSMYQYYYRQNQDVESSQGQSRASEFNEPVARKLKRNHFGQSVHIEGSLEQETICVLSNQGMHLKNQKVEAKTSQKVGQAGKAMSWKEGITPETGGQSANAIAARKAKATAYMEGSEKLRASTLSQQNLQSGTSTYRPHVTKHQDVKFLDGLLDSEPKMRLSALNNYIQTVWPEAKFTGTETFEGLKESLEKKAYRAGASASPFKWDWGQKVANENAKPNHLPWIEFLQLYRSCHRPPMLRWGESQDNYSRNLKLHLLCARAGAQRLDKLGIYTRLANYFAAMELRLNNQAKTSVAIRVGYAERKVESYLIPVRDATISMLYQAELLLRLSTPMLKDDELRHKEHLIEIMADIETFWDKFHPFEELVNQLQDSASRRSGNQFPTLMQKLKRPFGNRYARSTRSQKLSRILLEHWCLDRNYELFDFLKDGVGANRFGAFYALLADCTVHDLVHMIT